MNNRIISDLEARLQSLSPSTDTHKAEIKLDEYQKSAIYNNIIDIVKSGEKPHEVAHRIVSYLEHIIAEANAVQCEDEVEQGEVSKPLNSPIFRRSE